MMEVCHRDVTDVRRCATAKSEGERSPDRMPPAIGASPDTVRPAVILHRPRCFGPGHVARPFSHRQTGLLLLTPPLATGLGGCVPGGGLSELAAPPGHAPRRRVVVGCPPSPPRSDIDPRGLILTPCGGQKSGPFGAEFFRIFDPCGAKSWGGGGAPPTTLILLRNQWSAYREIVAPEHPQPGGPFRGEQKDFRRPESRIFGSCRC